MTPALVGLDAAGTADAWRAAGFTVEDETCWIGSVRVQCGVGSRGIAAWTFAGIEPIEHIDGLETRVTGATPSRPVAHANGATLIDHVVVWSPDGERTTKALEAAGVAARRVRDDARPGVRQTFFRAGEVIIELVSPPEPSEGTAQFFGIAVTVTDLDACAAALGDAVGRIKDAVQPGRRIATLRHKEIGLPVAVAYMSA